MLDIMQTWHLEVGDAVPYVEVGKYAINSDYIDTPEHVVAWVTDESSDLTSDMIVVDHKGTPRPAGLGIGTFGASGGAAAAADTTLDSEDLLILSISDSISSSQRVFSTDHPTFVSEFDLFGTDTGSLDYTEATLGAASLFFLATDVEIRVRSSLPAGAAGDRTFVVDGHPTDLSAGLPTTLAVVPFAEPLGEVRSAAFRGRTDTHSPDLIPSVLGQMVEAHDSVPSMYRPTRLEN